MIHYNLILILDPTKESVLMCKRTKEPYTGKYNLVGGKIEDNENPLDSAYRELLEETGITNQDVVLKPFMEFVWYPADMQMSVFFGQLRHQVTLQEEAHPLKWIPLTSDFFDTDSFAGEGNIGHMVAIYQLHKEVLLDD